jgi:hypothetical protein
MGDLKATIKSVLELARHFFIIVDALDECPYEERLQFFTILKEFLSWRLCNLHILVTSRQESGIMEALAPLVTLLPICIQTYQVDADISLYVKAQLANDLRLKQWSPQVKEEIETALVKGANGMYERPCCLYPRMLILPSKVSMGLLSIRLSKEVLEG